MPDFVPLPPANSLTPLEMAKFHRVLWKRYQVAMDMLANFREKPRPKRANWLDSRRVSHRDFYSAGEPGVGFGYAEPPRQQRKQLLEAFYAARDALVDALVKKLKSGDLVACTVPIDASTPYLLIPPGLWEMGLRLSLRS